MAVRGEITAYGPFKKTPWQQHTIQCDGCKRPMLDLWEIQGWYLCLICTSAWFTPRLEEMMVKATMEVFLEERYSREGA